MPTETGHFNMGQVPRSKVAQEVRLVDPFQGLPDQVTQPETWDVRQGPSIQWEGEEGHGLGEEMKAKVPRGADSNQAAICMKVFPSLL
jgi:hypothetical protein